ncbi:ANTAR domain-containing protein [Streptomyces sp. NPDC094038]|uniref:ANTAR domain-containing protein n=1 Tax=Streptomyces sp. NPDC094038 TaxID=3366055 RepID=UPI0037F78429
MAKSYGFLFTHTETGKDIHVCLDVLCGTQESGKGDVEEAMMTESSCGAPGADEGAVVRAASPPPTNVLLVQAGPDDARVSVTVSGEFCLDESQNLRRCLNLALGRSAQGIDLDLGGMTFADCSVLNVLLAVRRQAVQDGKTVIVTAASPVVERLLTVTDTYGLFSPARDDAGSSGVGPRSPGEGGAGVDDGLLQVEVVQLRRALRTRPDIDLARGILMASFGLNPDEAWEALVTASQNTNTKLHRLARDVVATVVQGAPLPDQVQRQLTTAVARARTECA